MTSRHLVLALALAALPAALPLAAQGAPQAAPAGAVARRFDYALVGMVGLATRSESGSKNSGVRFIGGLMALRPDAKPGELSGLEVSLSTAQINIERGTSGIRENSADVGLFADFLAASSGRWRVTGGAGLIASKGLGCMTDGSDSLQAGFVACPHAYAETKSLLLGYRARTTATWAGEWTSWIVGLDLTKHTVSAGNGIASGVFFGIRYSLEK